MMDPLRQQLDQAQAKIAELEAELAAASDYILEIQASRDREAGRLAAFDQLKADLTYAADGLMTIGKNTAFMRDPRFVEAYRRAMASGHRYAGAKADDLHVEWRIAVVCWAAKHASHLGGDFVECGTNAGMMSLAICDYVDFNSLPKDFYLFDTYEGIPLEQVSAAEDPVFSQRLNDGLYGGFYEIARRNFEPYPRAHLVKGRVPDTLSTVKIDRVSYLSIDMNIALPERAAIEHFWPKLVAGGIVVFDDYGFIDHKAQKATHDEFARSQGVEIFTLPTGQGLLLKP